ncbi:MAG: hypothetical protein J7M20_01195, partial [Deltaproteobacteria bacterium]|nr:hypothetical protein [Deltaproteobacteria bacterium]
DKVEPRREFIQKNAMEVTELDIWFPKENCLFRQSLRQINPFLIKLVNPRNIQYIFVVKILIFLDLDKKSWFSFRHYLGWRKVGVGPRACPLVTSETK